MRSDSTVGCILVLCGAAACPAGDPPRADREAEPVGPKVQAELREASELALKQDEHQHYWTDRVLLRIGEVQIRAGDVDGALRSIRGSSYPYGRNGSLVHLAEALARDGNRDRAFKVLRLLDADHGWRQDYLEDGVQLRWVEHLIASGDLRRAGKAVEQLKSDRYRPDGLRKLAVAYTSAGGPIREGDQVTLGAAVLYAIGDAQLKADRAKNVGRPAAPVELHGQYRDDSLLAIVDHDLAKRDFKAAVATAEKIDNPCKKAVGKLRVATAHANAGDRTTAARVAAGIELSVRGGLPGIGGIDRFDYRHPRTWGVNYDVGLGFTMASYRASIRQAAGVAAAAMTLAQALVQPPAKSYAILFNDINTEEVILALARAHAASGSASEALAWVQQIGGRDRVKSRDDDDARRAVQRRIHALIGFAEGTLDRSSGVQQVPAP